MAPRPGPAAVSETELRLRTVLEATLDAVVTIDDAGLVIGWNRQAEAIFGYSAAEAQGQRLSQLIIPPHLRDAHEQGHARTRATGTGPILNKRIEVVAQHRDGQQFPVELLVVPTIVGGQTTYTGFLHDISERKAAEQALREARDQLEQRVAERTRELTEEVARRTLAQEEAERHRKELVQAEKMIAMGTLVSGVAHEINNPNQFIMLNLPLLQQAWEDALPILDAWQAEHGASITRSIRTRRCA